MRANTHQNLDKYDDAIVALIANTCFSVAMGLVIFAGVHSFWMLVVMFAVSMACPIIKQRIKRYRKDKPPTKTAMKIAKGLSFLSLAVVIGFAVFVFYGLIVDR